MSFIKFNIYIDNIFNEYNYFITNGLLIYCFKFRRSSNWPPVTPVLGPITALLFSFVFLATTVASGSYNVCAAPWRLEM